MDFDSIRFSLNNILDKLEKIKSALNVTDKKIRIIELEDLTSQNDFWDNSEKSTKVLQEIKSINSMLDRVTQIESTFSDAKTYLDLAEESNDIESFKESQRLANSLSDKLDAIEIETLLSDEYDANNAIITIHPGAGGTESQDWANMLYRMYVKWLDTKDFGFELLDLQNADDAGIKGVSFLVKGQYAYGYLKGEKGVHRLVRISPFDANSRRHTSFAGVEVMPEMNDDNNITIKPEDLEIDTYRSSGAGGQHVNKTESAIRIKHVPSGIVVTCQTERSQLQNRENAMKMLRSKLYQMEKLKKEELINSVKGESSDNAWGSQIRSYVFCPYTLVKDHRTNFSIGDVQAVMDGKLDPFIFEYLKFNRKNDIID